MFCTWYVLSLKCFELICFELICFELICFFLICFVVKCFEAILFVCAPWIWIIYFCNSLRFFSFAYQPIVFVAILFVCTLYRACDSLTGHIPAICFANGESKLRIILFHIYYLRQGFLNMVRTIYQCLVKSYVQQNNQVVLLPRDARFKFQAGIFSFFQCWMLFSNPLVIMSLKYAKSLKICSI